MERYKVSIRLKELEKFEKNNKAIALNVLFVPCNTKKIKPTYISKYNHKRDNQVNLLMITDNDKRIDEVKNWHYLTIKSIPRSNHVEDFYCLDCFHSYTTKKKGLKNMKKYAKTMIFVI